MSEIPKILPRDQHEALQDEIRDVAQVAREADRTNDSDFLTDKHNTWEDGDAGESSTRHLGQGISSHRLRNTGDSGYRTRVDIYDGDREIRSISDRRFGSERTSTRMRVDRNGETKILQSDNPLVFRMLSGIALKDIRKKAQADIDESHKKVA